VVCSGAIETVGARNSGSQAGVPVTAGAASRFGPPTPQVRRTLLAVTTQRLGAFAARTELTQVVLTAQGTSALEVVCDRSSLSEQTTAHIDGSVRSRAGDAGIGAGLRSNWGIEVGPALAR